MTTSPAAGREPGRAERIFAAAAALTPEERPPCLDALCGGDARLRREIESLLLEHDADQDFMQAPACAVEAEAKPGAGGGPGGVPTGDDLPGTMIGPYRILSTIGAGGMGTVYLAEQSEPIRRRVALKVIKLGMDTRQVIVRFQAERQALAVMEHPGVARVFDAGATARGRPYFAMEYVRGPTITEYCDKRKLSVRERIELFIQVCEAVQHAHQKGVIHRDLKPGNILIEEVEGDPDRTAVPKVIDFGVAKAVGGGFGDHTGLTEHGQIIGTPAYMSPEQAGTGGLGRVGQDIDTRSDIYSLGVLLYELLAGAPPFDPRTFRMAGAAEIQRILRDSEPPRPSTRLSSLHAPSLHASPHAPTSQGPAAGAAGGPGPSPDAIAAQRRTNPSMLLRSLRGDLDWITMKAMEKDRTRRYASAHDLAEDLRRHLRHEPVTAGPPSVSYRFAKFARRNRVLLTGGGLVAAALVLGLGATLMALRHAEAAWKAEAVQRVVADQQTRVATQQAARARAVNDFLQNVLGAADPANTRGRETKIGEALDTAAARVEAGSLREHPSVEAAVRTTVGRVYQSLGRYPEAEKHLVAALAYWRMAPEEGPAELAMALESLSTVLRQQKRLEPAEAVGRELLENARRARGQDAPDPGVPGLAVALSNLGLVLMEREKFDEAVALFKESLSLVSASERPTADLAAAHNNLGLLLVAQGRFEDAEPLLTGSYDSIKKLLGAPHPDVARAANALGGLYIERDQAAKAERYFRESYDQCLVLYDATSPDVARAEANLGWALIDLRRAADAEPLLRHSLDARRAGLPAGNWLIGSSMNLLGASLSMQGKAEEAEPLLVDGYALMEAVPEIPEDRLRRAASRIVKHFEARGDSASAELWRAKAAP